MFRMAKNKTDANVSVPTDSYKNFAADIWQWVIQHNNIQKVLVLRATMPSKNISNLRLGMPWHMVRRWTCPSSAFRITSPSCGVWGAQLFSDYSTCYDATFKFILVNI
jgi:hypothetical protein